MGEWEWIEVRSDRSVTFFHCLSSFKQQLSFLPGANIRKRKKQQHFQVSAGYTWWLVYVLHRLVWSEIFLMVSDRQHNLTEHLLIFFNCGARTHSCWESDSLLVVCLKKIYIYYVNIQCVGWSDSKTRGRNASLPYVSAAFQLYRSWWATVGPVTDCTETQAHTHTKSSLPSYTGAIGARISVIHGKKIKRDFCSKLNKNLPSWNTDERVAAVSCITGPVH